MVRRTSLIKELEEKVHSGQKLDLYWALQKILIFDAQSGRNFPMQFYLAADVDIEVTRSIVMEKSISLSLS